MKSIISVLCMFLLLANNSFAVKKRSDTNFLGKQKDSRDYQGMAVCDDNGAELVFFCNNNNQNWTLWCLDDDCTGGGSSNWCNEKSEVYDAINLGYEDLSGFDCSFSEIEN